MPAEAPPLDVDLELVRRAVAGERLAFEMLVVKYQRRVAAIIRSYVRQSRIVEELTQEAFIHVYQNLVDFRAEGRFWAWVQTIARNTAASYLRSRQNRMEDHPRSAPEDDEQAPWERAPVASAPNAQDEVASQQLFGLIAKAIDALPAQQRDALIMREIEGLDYRSIAATLGVPLNTVRSLIFRGREAIAEQIRPVLAPTRSRRW
jgi:RNA polymerase sigma-70 factor (ECF subfamily)